MNIIVVVGVGVALAIDGWLCCCCCCNLLNALAPLRFSSLYYVTLQTEEQLTDSSSKIEAIVQKISQLTKEDPAVKIVIFSHWSHVLGILEEALIQTEISFRSRLGKFYQTIKEFKVGFFVRYFVFVSLLLIILYYIIIRQTEIL